MTNSGNKTRRWLLWLISGVVLVAFGWQFATLGRRVDWVAFGAALGRPGRWRWLVVALAMMPLNWWLEARKFHLLLGRFLRWPFGRAWRTVLAGVSVSAATPNRVGEIGGRLLLAERAEWPGVATASLLGGACQWVAFLLLAWPALMWTADGLLRTHLPFAVAWLWPLGPALLLVGWWGGLPLLDRLLRWTEVRLGLATAEVRRGLTEVKVALMARAGAYASLRFVVYCTQLYCLLWFFGVELDPVRGLAGIMAIYLVQAGLPLPPGVDLVTRTEMGLLVWGGAPETAVATLAAFTTLFAVNVLLPALPGYWLIVRHNRTTTERL